MVRVDPYINEPEQFAENSDYWYDSGAVQDCIQRRLEKDSERFSSYIEEWNKNRHNPDTIWKGVLTAVLQCLTNSWATSDQRFRRLWKNIKPHWVTFVIDFDPFHLNPKSYNQGITTREQCLHWVLVKFQKAATTLLKQGIAPKLLTHLNQTESDSLLFSDLKILFVCLRMRRVRVLHFHHPLLEEGLEDAAEMVSHHNNAPIADYAKKVLIIRPITAKSIPLMKFSREYRPNVSRRFKDFSNGRRYDGYDACSSEAETPIDVEKEAEKRAIHGQYREESSSEHTNNEDDDEEENDEDEEMSDEEEDEFLSKASDENEEDIMNTDAGSSEHEDDEADEQYDEEEEDNEGYF
ncbi:hypothetical protein BLNAU_16174 [Blattamonas nauphoetae]|uniref:Uncharacterized protein n=1 Tax=Blattamonas nauphoetae TaxID=2049346 RepID=A0ABQ9X8G6_9EUKA|nr:hypothetical protein BLNAU_16174 [Blattamonas nauphoetae]